MRSTVPRCKHYSEVASLNTVGVRTSSGVETAIVTPTATDSLNDKSSINNPSCGRESERGSYRTPFLGYPVFWLGSHLQRRSRHPKTGGGYDPTVRL